MRNPDFFQMLILQTDASNMEVGAMLSQSIREDWPIAYFSRKQLLRKWKYSVVEQKCLAVARGIKAFETYLLGKLCDTDRLLGFTLAPMIQGYDCKAHTILLLWPTVRDMKTVMQMPCHEFHKNFALKEMGGNVAEQDMHPVL